MPASVRKMRSRELLWGEPARRAVYHSGDGDGVWLLNGWALVRRKSVFKTSEGYRYVVSRAETLSDAYTFVASGKEPGV